MDWIIKAGVLVTLVMSVSELARAQMNPARVESECESAITKQIQKDHSDQANLEFNKHDLRDTAEGKADSWINGEADFQTNNKTLQYNISFRCDINPQNGAITRSFYKVNNGKPYPVKAAKPKATPATQANLGSDCDTVLTGLIKKDHPDATAITFGKRTTTAEGKADNWMHGEGSFVADGGTLHYAFSLRCDQNPQNNQVFNAFYRVNGGKGTPVNATKAAAPAAVTPAPKKK